MFNLKLKIKNLKLTFNERGYTAAEMSVALLALSLLIVSVLGVYKTIMRSYWQVDENSRLQRSAIFTMQQLVTEVRQARSVTQLGPYTPPANVTIDGVTYNAGTAYKIMPETNIHLKKDRSVILALMIPSITNPTNSAYDSILSFFLQPVTIGRTETVKLFQQLTYYNGTQTQAFPVMANTDRYRLGQALGTPEPTPGGPTPNPTVITAVPTPWLSFNQSMGRMPGIYNSPDLSFDDVTFFYDPANNLLAVGMVLSLKSKSLSWIPNPLSRRTFTLNNSVALRASAY